jgi:hypothetical protein
MCKSLETSDHLLKIGTLVYESKDFDYDSIGLSEDGKTLGVGYLNNEKASIIITDVVDHLDVHYNKKVSPYEALKFFIVILEQINTKIVIAQDF